MAAADATHLEAVPVIAGELGDPSALEPLPVDGSVLPEDRPVTGEVEAPSGAQAPAIGSASPTLPLPETDDQAPVVTPVDDLPAGPVVDEPSGFDASTSVIVPDAASTFADVYLNTDGSRTAVISPLPINYQAEDGSWQPIDTTVTVDAADPTVLVADGNAWSVRFAPLPDGITISLREGDMGFTPVDASGVAPAVAADDPSAVVYEEAWPGVDLLYKVTASGVKESIVIKGPKAAASFEFAVTGADLSPDPEVAGALRPDGALGDTVQIAPVSVVDAAGLQVTAQAVGAMAAAAKSGTPDPSRVTAGVDPEWLASQPASAFPIVIDPTVGIGASRVDGYANGGWWCSSNPSCWVVVGNSLASGNRWWRSVAWMDYGGYLGSTLQNAQLILSHVGGSTANLPVAVRHASAWSWCGVSNPPGTPDSCGPYSGTLGVPYISTGSAAVDVTNYLRGYWDAGNPWVSWAFSGDESAGAFTYKELDAYLQVTYNWPPSPPSLGGATPYGRNVQGWINPAVDPENATISYMYVAEAPDGTRIARWGPTPSTTFGISVGPEWYGDQLTLWVDYNDGVNFDSAFLGYWTPTNRYPAPPPSGSPGTTTNHSQSLAVSVPEVVDPDGDQVYYQFILCSSNPCAPRQGNNPGSNWVDWEYSDTTPSATLQAPNYNTPYWWTVEVLDGYQGWPNAQKASWNNAWTVANQAPSVESLAPANNTVWTKAAPSLSGTVRDGDGDALSYRFVVRPAGGIGIQVESGWLAAAGASQAGIAVSWTPPPGSLQTGQGYTWSLEVRDGIAPDLAGPSRSLRVDQRLGVSGPSPIQPAGDVAVNLATGNLAMVTASSVVSTVGGPVGVSYVYNSLDRSSQGLTGSYWVDANSNGSFEESEVVLRRTDPVPSFVWDTQAPSPSVPSDFFRVRWTGWVTPPVSGAWSFDGLNDDWVQVKINGTVVVNQACCTGTVGPADFVPPGSPASVNLTAGTQYPIEIDYLEHTGPSYVMLKAKTGGVERQVGADWFSTEARVLPRGWSMTGVSQADLRFVQARVGEQSIVLSTADGATVTYTRTGSTPPYGWTPPGGEDDVVAVNPDGAVVVHGIDGLDYRFGKNGTLESVVSVLDDKTSAAAVREYTGSPPRLTALKDPARQDAAGNPQPVLQLTYSVAGSTCPQPAGFQAAPAGMLCRLTYADGTTSDLLYNGGQLVRIVDPGNEVSDFGYDQGRLNRVRNPLAADRVAWELANAISGGWGDDDDSRTVIGYDANGKASSVIQPAPLATTVPAARPGVTVAYLNEFSPGTPGLSRVHVLGLNDPDGWERQVTFDESGRALEDTDAAGRVSSTIWDGPDRALATTTAGRRSTTRYDSEGRVTDVYGPAPVACFDATHLPKPNPTTVPGCGTDVPSTHTDYDGNMVGLGFAFWSAVEQANPFRQRALTHATSPVNVDWGAAAPAAGVSADNFAVRATGEVTVSGAGGNHLFSIAATNGTAQLFIDDGFVIAAPNTSPNINLTPGKHRIRVDYVHATGTAGFSVGWQPPGQGWAQIPVSLLGPRYGLSTRTTVNDSGGATPTSMTETRYDEGIDPFYGLATSTTQDPSGLGLKTVTSHEAPGTGFMRRTRQTLPAAAGSPTDTNSTTYRYWGAQATTAIPCTGGASNVAQAARERYQIDPVDADNQRMVTETVYDPLGRTAAVRAARLPAAAVTSTTVDFGSTPWECTRYDNRGRTIERTIPASGGFAARTVTLAYTGASGTPPVSGDPLVSTVADPAGTITDQSDLLGRTIRYTDVWGKVTTTLHDQAGRVTSTSGANGLLATSYDNLGRVTQVSLDGQLVAVPVYRADNDPLDAGALNAVTYPAGAGNAGNGTSLAPIGRDRLGRVTDLHWKQAGGSLLTRDQVTRSLTGRIIDERYDTETVASRGYEYDRAGRLTRATLPGHDLRYEFGTTDCSGTTGAATTAGLNTNRARLVDNGVEQARYCYDAADRLRSTTAVGYSGAIGYDGQGNTTTLAGQTLGYDGADRHLTTTANGTTVTYTRDAQDRIISRTFQTAGGGTGTVTSTSVGGWASDLNFGTGPYITPTFTPPAETLLVATVSYRYEGCDETDTTPITLTDTAGRTWTRRVEQGGVAFCANRIAIFTSEAGASPGATALTATAAGEDMHSWGVHVQAYAGHNPANPVGGSGSGAVDGVGTGPFTFDLAATPATGSVVHSAVAVSEFGGTGPYVTPAAGWTEQYDANSPDETLQIQTGTVGTVEWTATGSVDSWKTKGAAIEIRAAATGSGVTVTRYSYTGNGDTPDAVLDTTNAAIERTVSLPGGALLTKRGSGDAWSYPNIHGDISATANATGAKTGGGTMLYDPYGNPLGPLPDNSASDLDYAWLGQHQRPVEHAAGIAQSIEMGARVYTPALGRFLQIDPIDGASANHYDYASGDPVNTFDLDGKAPKCKCGGGSGKKPYIDPKIPSLLKKGWNLLNRIRPNNFVWRGGRPALHLFNHQWRLEWDRKNKWHVNSRGGGHPSPGSYVARAASSAISRVCGPMCLIPIPKRVACAGNTHLPVCGGNEGEMA